MDDFEFLHTSFCNERNLAGKLPRVVLVEDDVIFNKTIKKFLSHKLGLNVITFSTPNDCLESIDTFELGEFCLITDISFDDASVDGLMLVDLLKERGHKFASLAMTGFASIETAITATKKGVFHYLTKPFELEVFADIVKKVFVEQLNVSEDFWERCSKVSKAKEAKSSVFFNKFKIEPPKEEDLFCGMVGRSKKMKDVFERIKLIARTDSTVLVNGPSGTGKELIASAIHNISRRSVKRMISVNCGAIPGELLESELFGHVKGAFTGAVSNRKGRFELANKGTIFLDEIGDMPLLLQVKILRVLQSRTIEAVGGTTTADIDVRIITATHQNLEQAVREGTFREDLFYRLNVIPVRVPPLSERREDIPLLIHYFLSRFVSADGRNKIDFDDDALELLMSYEWPGNVRELENLMERLVILKGGSLITAQDLPAKFLQNRPFQFGFDSLINLPDDGLDLKDTLSLIEDSLIRQALNKTEGNKNQASKLLQMNRTTLIEKMKKKGLMHI